MHTVILIIYIYSLLIYTCLSRIYVKIFKLLLSLNFFLIICYRYGSNRVCSFAFIQFIIHNLVLISYRDLYPPPTPPPRQYLADEFSECTLYPSPPPTPHPRHNTVRFARTFNTNFYVYTFNLSGDSKLINLLIRCHVLALK